MTDALVENWRDVPGYEGWYEVSDLGRVRRIRPARGARFGHVLSVKPGPLGYARVCLSQDSSKDRKWLYIHQLVARAFLPAPAFGSVVNHIDFDRMNNRPENLEYVTQRENVLHTVKAGRHRPRTRLTDNEVQVIRNLRGRQTTREISEQFGVSQSYVSQLQTGSRRGG